MSTQNTDDGAAQFAELIAKALDIGGVHDAIDNLEGALLDLRRTGADRICTQTVARVQRQIVDVAQLAETALAARKGGSNAE